MIGIVEDEGGRLVDRRGAGAGGGSGLAPAWTASVLKPGVRVIKPPFLKLLKWPGILGEARRECKEENAFGE